MADCCLPENQSGTPVPLYLAGLLLGFVVAVLLDAMHHNRFSNELAPLGLGLIVLPVVPLHRVGTAVAYPLNYPSWTIFFELLINLVHAALLRRRSTSTLILLAALSFSGLAAYAFRLGTINVGVDSPTNFFCMLRIAFSYVTGMLLYRRWRSRKSSLRLPALVIAAFLLLVLGLPYTAERRVLQELTICAIVFPWMILAAANSQTSPRLTRLFVGLGQASYAIYIFHAPMFALLNQAWGHVTKRAVSYAAPWFGILFLIFLMLIALWIDRIYDVPARAYLRRMFLHP